MFGIHLRLEVRNPNEILVRIVLDDGSTVCAALISRDNRTVVLECHGTIKVIGVQGRWDAGVGYETGVRWDFTSMDDWFESKRMSIF